MILPVIDGETIIFFSCLFQYDILPCACLKIILFLKQESGFEALTSGALILGLR